MNIRNSCGTSKKIQIYVFKPILKNSPIDTSVGFKVGLFEFCIHGEISEGSLSLKEVAIFHFQRTSVREDHLKEVDNDLPATPSVTVK